LSLIAGAWTGRGKGKDSADLAGSLIRRQPCVSPWQYPPARLLYKQRPNIRVSPLRIRAYCAFQACGGNWQMNFMKQEVVY